METLFPSGIEPFKLIEVRRLGLAKPFVLKGLIAAVAGIEQKHGDHQLADHGKESGIQGIQHAASRGDILSHMREKHNKDEDAFDRIRRALVQIRAVKGDDPGSNKPPHKGP